VVGRISRFHIARRTKSIVCDDGRETASGFICFPKVGRVFVVRENPREAMKSIDYSVEFYPKSRAENSGYSARRNSTERYATDRILQRLAHIIKKIENCRIINLSVRYEFLGSFKPDIL
jgi:hypothetical protein